MQSTSGSTKRRALVATAVAMVVLALVAGPASAADVSMVKAAKVKEAGIAFGYPSTWSKVTYTKDGLRKGIARLARTNPNLAKRLDDETQSAVIEGARFQAMDLDGETFHSNVIVATIDESFPSPDERADMRAAFGTVGFGVLRTSSPKFGKREGYRFDLTRTINAPDGTRLSVRFTELLVPNGDATTIVAVGATADAGGGAVIESIMQSVRAI